MNNDNKNKDLAKGQHDKSELTNTSKGSSTDTSNSLAKDNVGKVESDKITPQNRTDNEQEEQQKK